MSSKETGHYDRRGLPICVGDLIRIAAFRHQLRGEQMWAYCFVCTTPGGQPALRAWYLPDDQYHCLLSALSNETVEVLDSHRCETDEQGCLRTFNERPRRTKR